MYARQIKVLSFGLMAIVLMNACKKKKEESASQALTTGQSTSSGSTGSTTSSGPVSCILYTTVSPDPNYIPHRKNNAWNYCSGSSSVGFMAYIVKDTLINNRVCFDVKHEPTSSQVAGGRYTEKWFIDPAGSYYQLNMRTSGYQDTILMIKPGASNGDTLYKYAPNQVKVVLINKNETVGTLSGCYHVRQIQFNDTTDRYFKIGIGELYVNNTSFLLQSATIQ